jgi:hypothetical protein
MKWCRLWTDVLDDVKMLQLTDYEFRMFIYLMCYASEVNSLSGEFQITFKSLSIRFHQRFNLFSRAIETFQRLGLVTINEGGFLTITNWSKRQFKSDDSYARVKKFREVSPKRNVSVTVNETVPDTDTDTDTERHIKKTVIYSEDFLKFWSCYPKRVGKDAAWKSWVKRNGERPDISNLIKSVEKQKVTDQWIKEKGQFIPNPATWLNQGRWADEVSAPVKSLFKD